MCGHRGPAMSSQNETPEEKEPTAVLVGPAPTTSSVSSRVNSASFHQQLHVNLERMPISIVPKHVRSDQQLPVPSPPKPSNTPDISKDRTNCNAPTLVSTLAAQPQPQVVIPRLPIQARHKDLSHVPDRDPAVHTKSEFSSSKQIAQSSSDLALASTDPDTSSSSTLHVHQPRSPVNIAKHVPSQTQTPSPVSSPKDPSKPVTPIVRIKGITTGQPVLVESPPFADNLISTPVAGAKKRRGERGPDKNPNIDPRTGKRRYIKRKNKRFGVGFDLGDLDYLKKDKKKWISKYLSGTDLSAIPKVGLKGIRKRLLHEDRHNRHHRHSSHKYSSEHYITPWSRGEESDAESLGSSQEDASERQDVMDSVWRPTDDLRLIMNVIQTNDLREVLLGTKFSSYYSLDEIESRWDYLLFDESMCKVSQNAIRNLPGRLKYDICSKALFSTKENALLQEISSNSDPKQLLPVMKKLLSENPLVFLKWRSPQQLTRQWMHLRDFHLLCDQDVRHYFAQHNFEDFERTVNDYDLYPLPFVDDAVMQEKLIHKRICREKIRKLEKEVTHWQAVAEKSIPGIRPVFEKDAYAMLRGRVVSYFMRHKEITFGRRTENTNDRKIDADLTLEGSIYKISRIQGIISLREKGDFVILNQGKHTIYVDGKPLYPQTIGALRDHSVIEVSLLSFVFLFNHELLRLEAERRLKLERARMESMIFGSIPRQSRSMFSPSLYLPPHISNHLSSTLSSSILTSSLSNTLPPLIGSKKLLASNNSPLQLLSSDKTNLSIPNLSQVLKPSGMTSPTLRGSLLGNNSMFTRPSWYLEPSRSEPPPLTTTSRISSPIINSLQLASLQSELRDSAPLLSRSLSLPYSQLPSLAQTLISPTKSTHISRTIATSTTMVTFSTSATSSPTGTTPTSAQTKDESPVANVTMHSNSIQFGDLTIRPGIPPPSETTTFNSS